MNDEERQKRTNAVNQIGKVIHDVDPAATIILYGSEARGDSRSDSDIDVLILVGGNDLNLEREQRYTTPLFMIEWKTGIQVSPTVMLRKNWDERPFKTPFYINVKNEGRMI